MGAVGGVGVYGFGWGGSEDLGLLLTIPVTRTLYHCVVSSLSVKNFHKLSRKCSGRPFSSIPRLTDCKPIALGLKAIMMGASL